jgi:hypothetical protein
MRGRARMVDSSAFNFPPWLAYVGVLVLISVAVGGGCLVGHFVWR